MGAKEKLISLDGIFFGEPKSGVFNDFDHMTKLRQKWNKLKEHEVAIFAQHDH